MTEPVGSDAWLAQVFDADDREELFAGHAPDQAAPVLVLLGGQPAAGKTRAQQVILRERAALDIDGPTYAHEVLTTAEVIDALGR